MSSRPAAPAISRMFLFQLINAYVGWDLHISSHNTGMELASAASGVAYIKWESEG